MKEEKRIIRVCFTDMPREFDAGKFQDILPQESRWEIDEENPDVVVYSVMGYRFLRYGNSLRFFLCSENSYPDFSVCDYAASLLRDSFGGRNIHKLFLPSPGSYPGGGTVDASMAKRSFASFIASQDTVGYGAKLRRDFTQFLSENYKRVDCPGRVLHNTDIPGFGLRGTHSSETVSKLDVISRYKFNITFENSNTDGYITEKLTDAFMAFTVPVYFGSEGNVTPFPKEAMICANDYDSFEALAARVREADENDELYMSILRANPILTGEFDVLCRKQQDEFRNILSRIEQDVILRRTSPFKFRERPIYGSVLAAVTGGRGCQALKADTSLRLRIRNTLHLYSLLPGKNTRYCPIKELLSGDDKP